MSSKFRHHFPKSFSLLVLFLLALLGLQGCFRGGWHSGDRVERMEKRIDWIQEEHGHDPVSNPRSPVVGCGFASRPAAPLFA